MTKRPKSATSDVVDSIRVGLDDRAYEIVVGDGVLAQTGPRAAKLFGGGRLIVVTDETVAALHLPRLRENLSGAGLDHDALALPAGEQTKSFRQLESLCGDLLDLGLDRGAGLIALGGGVIGDIAGLAASILLRGIGFIQIPTTLVAQVDSSVGGKTGINTPQGKNLVGSFHQPRLVIADTALLDTLPRRELLAGYAEAVKYGLVGDPAYFAWCEKNGARLIDGDPAARRHAVITTCDAKAQIVAADETETGVRALLNLGHTFGHALEAETGYSGDLLHGEAVAIGMVMAFDLSVRLGLCPPEDAARVRRHLADVGLPTDLPAGRRWNTDVLLRHMAKDKKVRDGRITFILVRGIGKAFVSRDVDARQLRALLDTAVAA